MKRFFLLGAASLFAFQVEAQPWMSSSSHPQKLENIIQNYEQLREKSSEQEVAGEDREKEGKDYHFSRWTWYWERHLDENGYMVSPLKTYEEWKAYKEKLASSKSKYKTTNQSQWTFKGPSQSFGGNRGQGRINVIEFHPTNINTYIIGSAGGGAWRTTNDGLSWTPLYNDLPVLGVSDVDYNPLNPNTIYLCTGDRDAGDTYTMGLMKSYDGGATWNTTGLQFAISSNLLINNLIINPLDTNSLTVATSTNIRRSFDGGTSWQIVASGDFKQVIYHPTDTNIMYAASYSSGNSNIFRSSNAGLNWQQVTSLSDSRRIMLAVSPASPRLVKAVIANNQNGLNGIYHSSDTGKSFTRIYGGTCNTNILNGSANLSSSTCDGQGWYDLAIAMSPIDSNRLVVGGINTWQSLNGGNTWTMINQAYGGGPGVANVHADKHYLAFHPLNPIALFECHDGGLSKTTNIAIWSELSNGLNITQFYRNAVAGVADFCIGGAQDNGTKRMNFNNTATHLTGGDGMDCQIDYSNASTFYTSSQNGSINRTQNGGGSYSSISATIPGNPTGAWITPFIIHPIDPTMLVAGYDHVYLSYNRGGSWTDISPGFSVGSNTKIKRLAMTSQDQYRIFVLSGTSTLRYTDDLGQNWKNVPSGFSGTISDITVDPRDRDLLWVSYSGYTNARVATWRIGGSWTLKNDSLPNIPVNCLAIDSANGTVYAGVDGAVFYRDWTMTGWALYNNGLPSAEIMDLGLNYTTNEIWAASYGRGIWKSPKHDIQPNNVLAIPYATDVISVYPNPNNGQFTLTTGNKALENQVVDLRIISYSGAVVMKTTGKFDHGQLKVNTAQLARGTYFVEVNKQGNLFAKTKMIVL